MEWVLMLEEEISLVVVVMKVSAGQMTSLTIVRGD
jgi:hypothetical protein